MATYQIKDPQTGKTVTVKGERPPTQADAQSIFVNAGLRSATTAPAKEPSILDRVGSAIAPTMSSLARGAGALMSTFSSDAREADESMARAETMNQRLQEAARNETDPDRKKFLVDAALSSSKSLGDIGTDRAKGYQESAGISDREMEMSTAEYTGRKAAGATAEAASIMAPFAKGANVARATRLGRVGQSAMMGTGQGALMGFGRSVGEGDSAGEVAMDTLTGGAVGGVSGAVVQGAIETPGLIKSMASGGKEGLKNQLVNLYKTTLKQNIADRKFYQQAGGEKRVIEDAIEFDLPTTKDGMMKALNEYGDEYNRVITSENRKLDKRGIRINVANAFNRARARLAKTLGSYDQTLSDSADSWFTRNESIYLKNTNAKPLGVNELRQNLDKKVGDQIAGDITAASDMARKALATELRQEFKKVIGKKGLTAIRKYQLLAGLSEAFQKQPILSLPEITGAAVGATVTSNVPGGLVGLAGSWAVRNPGLKRKIAKEIIKTGVGSSKKASPGILGFMEPVIKPPAQQQMGSLVSPFAASVATEEEN